MWMGQDDLVAAVVGGGPVDLLALGQEGIR